MALNGNVAGKLLRGRINSIDTLILSAYAIAVKNGFEGTEEEWLASLNGENGNPGKDGYSIFYMNSEVDYPVEGFAGHMITKPYLSNNGNGVKVGDLLISSNGVLCEVTSVQTNHVNYNPIAKFSEDKEDIVTSVLEALPTWTGGSY